MSFEGITCPNDGAIEGITQVEPDTFYCSHCKSLFKYVDPRRFKVQVEGSFCSCGNRVEFRCQLCNKELCPECDVIEWQMGSWAPSGHPFVQPTRYPRTLIVAAQDFGYLAQGDSLKAFVPIYGRISMSSVAGPTLYASEILSQLAKGRPSGLRHLCGACLKTGVPAAIAAIASGQMCESPGCAEKARVSCQCCGSAFCAQHIRKTEMEEFRENPNLATHYLRNIASIRCKMGFSPSEHDPHIVLRGPEVAGLCQMCASERVEETRQAVVSICDSWHGIARENESSADVTIYNVLVPWWAEILDNAFYTLEIKRKRAQMVCDRIEKVVAEKNRELARRSSPCARDRLVDKRGAYRFIGPRDRRSHASA